MRSLRPTRMPILLVLLAFALGCKFDRRETFDFSIDQPLRCGIFKSYYFVRDIQQEVYPDLGLLIANSQQVGLTPGQVDSIRESARHCTENCEVQKDKLRIMQEDIKTKLALNAIKGDLRLLAREVREFEEAKIIWLKEHAHRYRLGLSPLNEQQRAKWQMAEAMLRKLPAEEQTR